MRNRLLLGWHQSPPLSAPCGKQMVSRWLRFVAARSSPDLVLIDAALAAIVARHVAPVAYLGSSKGKTWCNSYSGVLAFAPLWR